MVRLIRDISESNRIEPFPVAVANHNPPKCEFFPRFETLGWKYLDVSDVETKMNKELSDVEAKMKKELVMLPFGKDYS